MDDLIEDVALVPGADHRQPAQGDREQQDRPDRHQKGRDRDGADRDDAGEPIEPGVRPGCRQAAQRDPDKRRPAQRRDREADRERQLLGQRQGDAAVGEDIAAKIALQHVAGINQELISQRFVEVHLGGIGRLNLGRRPRAEGNAGRIARDGVQHQEQRRHRQQDDDDRQAEPLEQIPPHVGLRLRDHRTETAGAHLPRQPVRMPITSG